jgi:hypothetical protein
MLFKNLELDRVLGRIDPVEEFFIPFPKPVLKAIQSHGFAFGFKLAHGKIEDMNKEQARSTITKFEDLKKTLIANSKDTSFQGRVLTHLGQRGGSIGVNAYTEIENLIELCDEYLIALKKKEKELTK